MKFSTRKDIEASAEFVFARLSDFDGLERQAMRRGFTIKRKLSSADDAAGPAWEMIVPFRGKKRQLDAHIAEMDAPNSMTALAKSGGLNMVVTLDLVPLSKKRTRLTLGYEVRPETLSARILVQSVKFAKGSMQKRFEKRVEKYCDHISETYEATQ